MNKRRLRNRGDRPKAVFGSDAGAILAAAGINVAGTMAASAISANAARKAAQDQARATIQAAQRQSQAIKDQTDKAREYQQEAQEFTREQNAENRELQRDVQMQLQLLTGQQNVNDRLEAAKIKVKAGGNLKSSITRKIGRLSNSKKRRLNENIKKYNKGYYDDIDYDLFERTGLMNDLDYNNQIRYTAKNGTSLLRGGNMPFQVTDGGIVIPVGRTPEGFDLYELAGNDHEHYHKSRGKYKSGVGIKFADGNIVEGEGNQNSSQGELMLVTPDDAYFISKHNIAGFNPAKMVEQGVHPLEAFTIQEQAKAMKGINDDGTKAKFGKKRFLIGGTPNLYDYSNMGYPQVGTDTIGDTAVGVVYATQNPTEKRRLRCGGKTRTKAVGGTVINNWWNNLTPQQRMNITLGVSNPVQTAAISTRSTGNTTQPIRTFTPQNFEHAPYNNGTSGNAGTTTTRGGGFSGWVNNNADLLGAGLNALGNIGGAWITSSANRSAANTLADAYSKGADIMAEAYRNLRTIDMNSLRREDYRAAHMMPALQAPVSFAANQVAGVNRSLQRRLRNAGRYSMSSAAAQDRMTNAEIESQDARNRIYSADQQQMQDIRQKNAERVSEASRVNAMLDTQANQQYGQDYLKLLQYNNDIENQRILGSAGALSEGAINGASAISQGQTSSAQAWATALANSGLTFSNTLSSMATRRANFENTMLGATTDAQINQIARSGSDREKRARLEAVRAAIKSGRLSPEYESKYKYYEELLLKSL